MLTEKRKIVLLFNQAMMISDQIETEKGGEIAVETEDSTAQAQAEIGDLKRKIERFSVLATTSPKLTKIHLYLQ